MEVSASVTWLLQGFGGDAVSPSSGGAVAVELSVQPSDTELEKRGVFRKPGLFDGSSVLGWSRAKRWVYKHRKLPGHMMAVNYNSWNTIALTTKYNSAIQSLPNPSHITLYNYTT